MTEALTYDFRIIGLQAVNAALAGIERRYVEHNRRMSGEMRKTVGGSSPATSKARATSAEREELLRQKMLDREHERAATERTRADARRLRDNERAQREQTRTNDREARRRTAIASAEARHEEAARRRFRASTAHAVTGAFGRSVGTVGSWAAGAGTLLGGLGAGMAVSSQMGLIGRASSLANQAGAPGRKSEILAFSQTIQGVSGEQAIGALEQWQTLTGQLDVGMGKLREFNDLALATGTDLGDMTSAAASAFTTLATDIKDPKEQMKALTEVMATFAAQGAIGAVELKQLATEMPGLAATASKFGKDRALAMKELGAIAQVARAKGGASSTPEVITSLERFGSEIISKEADLKAMGVDIWGDKKLKGRGKLKTAQELIVQIVSKSRGDLSKLGGVFNERSIRAVQGFASVYQAAESTKAGSGEAAVRAQFGEFLGPNVQLGADEIQRRAASRKADPDLMLAEAVKKFKYSVGSELLPVLTQLIPEVAKLTPKFAEAAKAAGGFISWATKHPTEGIGVALAALMAKDIAAAGIGASVRTAMETGFSSMAGKFGAAGIAISIGTASFLITKALIEAHYAEKVEKEKRTAVADATAGATLANARTELATTGTLSPETQAKVKEALKTEEGLSKGALPAEPGSRQVMTPLGSVETWFVPGSTGKQNPAAQDAFRTAEELRGQLLGEWFAPQGSPAARSTGVAANMSMETDADAAAAYEDRAAYQAMSAEIADSTLKMGEFSQAAAAATKQLLEIGSITPNRGNSPTAPK
jgi:hypothetical protein